MEHRRRSYLVDRDLTPEELEQSSNGPTFEGVTFEQMLADGHLAETVMRRNPAAYREKKLDFLYRTGQRKRPASEYR